MMESLKACIMLCCWGSPAEGGDFHLDQGASTGLAAACANFNPCSGNPEPIQPYLDDSDLDDDDIKLKRSPQKTQTISTPSGGLAAWSTGVSEQHPFFRSISQPLYYLFFYLRF